MSSRSKGPSAPSAVVLGCGGTTLTDAERAFFRKADPFGLILFARNVGAPETLRRLIADFRETVGRPEAPVFVDQEGGRVARLRPPHWPALPPAGAIGRLAARAPERGLEAAALLGAAIAASVAPVGFDVACAPVADVRAPGADRTVVGDRAFSDDPDEAARLAKATEAAIRAAGIATTPKHAPGHGRAALDSHHALPTVTAPVADLVRDLAPFRAMTAAAFWMTAHIVYPAIDPDRPATCSPRVLDWLRGETGYDGVILSDDLAMKALAGDVETRAAAARDAGCELLLYCPGDLAGGAAAVAGAGRAPDRLLQRWSEWTSARAAPPHMDAFQLAADLWAMLEPADMDPGV